MSKEEEFQKTQPRLAQKKYGQNYLVNQGMQKKVFHSFESIIQLYPNRSILEIGPGEGDLSQYLLEYGSKLTMIEIDRSKYEYLQNTLEIGKSKLILGDAYKDLKRIRSIINGDFVLVSNLPFNVGSRILVDLVLFCPFTPIVVVLQKEVAKKCLLSSDLTFFGAWMNLFWDIQIKFDISRGNFIPVPKVVSSLLQGIPKETLWNIDERLMVKEILKSLFAMPNKTVWNNLKKAGWDKELLETIWKKESFEPNLRLTWHNYESILIILLENYKRINLGLLQ